MIFASLLIFQLLSKMYDKYIMTAQALTYARTTGLLSNNKMRKTSFLFH